jgi:hypothetical protein
MTTYRLMDGVSGRPGVGSSGTQPPSLVTGTTGGWLLGTIFTLTTGMQWLDGYWFWVPEDGDTAPSGGFRFALWDIYASGPAASLVSGSEVTASTLTAGTFNYVALSTPLQLAPGELYEAVIGWTVSAGIPLSAGQFGSGDPYSGGITNGPLFGWPNLGSAANPYAWATTYGMGQGLFSSSSGSDPTAAFPENSSGSDLFWVDVQVSSTSPAGYAGSYRLRPNAVALGTTSNTVTDTASNFTLGVEFSLSQACAIDNIWFYSAPGLTQLPTGIGVYNVSTQTLTASSASPSWSGSAGSGWVSAALSGTLAASTNYKAVVVNGAGSPVQWNQAITDFWDPSAGWGGSGLTAGPLTYPDTSDATSPGQASYNAGAVITYPETNAGPYDYGVDIELTPGTPHTAAAVLEITPSLAAQAARGHARSALLALQPQVQAAGTVLGPAVIFTPGDPYTEWTVSWTQIGISQLSTEYVLVPVKAAKAGASYNPTGDTVQMAFMALPTQVPGDDSWISASWDSDSSDILYPYSAKCLVGPAGTTNPGIGTYVIYLKVTDDPEVPVMVAGQLQIQ